MPLAQWNKILGMKELSNRINSLPISATLAMAAKARELKTRINVIGLSLNPILILPNLSKKLPYKP